MGTLTLIFHQPLQSDFRAREEAWSNLRREKRTDMKRRTLCLIAGAIFLGMVTMSAAKQDAGKGKPSSGSLSADVCSAMEQYLARIDAAGALKEKAKREEKYAEARKELTEVLKRHDRASLLAEALEYENAAEQVVTADPTTDSFPGLVEKRINLRGELLGRCPNFKTTR